ncbi:hypothetical protein LC55x_0066 [Lysobacter capsici]|nr:hypothetical protein LC55x_0066 [Lysobacter capsici]
MLGRTRRRGRSRRSPPAPAGSHFRRASHCQRGGRAAACPA